MFRTWIFRLYYWWFSVAAVNKNLISLTEMSKPDQLISAWSMHLFQYFWSCNSAGKNLNLLYYFVQFKMRCTCRAPITTCCLLMNTFTHCCGRSRRLPRIHHCLQTLSELLVLMNAFSSIQAFSCSWGFKWFYFHYSKWFVESSQG